MFWLLADCAAAQVMDASGAGGLVVLKGNWRFHAGDNPAWADPHFDDSRWRLVSTEKVWDQQGLQGVRGYVWYRAVLRLPANRKDLSLLLTELGPYELYLDGHQLGGVGSFPPHPVVISDFPHSYDVPASSEEKVSLAIRYWISPLFFHVGKLATGIAVGTRRETQREQDRFFYRSLSEYIPALITSSIGLIVCAGLGILFYLQRDHSEYLFLCAAVLCSSCNILLSNIQSLAPISLLARDSANALTAMLAAMATIEFAFRFLRQPVPKWMRAYQLSLPLLWVAVIVTWHGGLSPALLNAGSVVLLAPYWFLTPGSVFWRFLRGNKEAGLLAIPLFLVMLDDMLGTLGWALYQLHLRGSNARFLPELHAGIIAIEPGTIFWLAFLLSVAALILYRFQQTRSEQARASAELEAARGMQEVMVPSSVAATGFHIETAYVPAQEVGGDFFQLFPGEDGSLLVVIGDVSGKGVKAAMLVSMILGMLQSLVEQTRSPGRMLRDLNRLLAGHTDGKFATCCVALLYADGRVVVANAGHLSPYCDGQEVAIPGGLPLGLSADVEYEELSMEAAPGKRWVFLSDGVVEARSKSGELYGFERARRISGQGVKTIVQLAQQFGQEDDITVLGIEARRLSVLAGSV